MNGDYIMKTETFEQGIHISFIAAKRDIYALKEHINKQTAHINKQNELIIKLSKNQKYLLAKIMNLEKKLDEEILSNIKKQKVMEKKIVLASPKRVIIKKPVVKEVKVKKTVKKSVKNAYVGSKNRMKLHNPVCPYAKNIKPKNKASFKSKVKPLNLGYRECNCLKKF